MLSPDLLHEYARGVIRDRHREADLARLLRAAAPPRASLRTRMATFLRATADRLDQQPAYDTLILTAR